MQPPTEGTDVDESPPSASNKPTLAQKATENRINPSHHLWSCQLFNMPVKCKNAGKVIPALTVYGTGFLWSFTKGFYVWNYKEGMSPLWSRKNKNELSTAKRSSKEKYFSWGLTEPYERSTTQ